MKLEDFIRQRLQELREFFPGRFGRGWRKQVAAGTDYKHVPVWLTHTDKYPRFAPFNRKRLQRIEDFAFSVGFNPRMSTLLLPVERKKFDRVESLVKSLGYCGFSSLAADCLNALAVLRQTQHKFRVIPRGSDVLSEGITITPLPDQRTSGPLSGGEAPVSSPVSVDALLALAVVPGLTPGPASPPEGGQPTPPRSLNPPGAKSKPLREEPKLVLTKGDHSGRSFRYGIAFKRLLLELENDHQIPLENRLYAVSKVQRVAEGILQRAELSEKLADGKEP